MSETLFHFSLLRLWQDLSLSNSRQRPTTTAWPKREAVTQSDDSDWQVVAQITRLACTVRVEVSWCGNHCKNCIYVAYWQEEIYQTCSVLWKNKARKASWSKTWMLHIVYIIEQTSGFSEIGWTCIGLRIKHVELKPDQSSLLEMCPSSALSIAVDD